jgi:DNA/RNA-binding domain of Phe-tRNA-synthetase-like protein
VTPRSGDPPHSMSEGPEPELGWIDPQVAEEFPKLRVWQQRVEATDGPSSPGLRERLRLLSDRFHGAHAIAMRREPVPHAYRVFFRHIGIDPDDERTPVEAAALARLTHGGFRSIGRLADGLLLAVVETGVPVWALDDEHVTGDLGIRPAGPAERLGRGELAPDVRPGRLVVADDHVPLAELFGTLAPGVEVTSGTTAMRLFSVQAPGVPGIHVEEALWTCTEALDTT